MAFLESVHTLAPQALPSFKPLCGEHWLWDVEPWTARSGRRNWFRHQGHVL